MIKSLLYIGQTDEGSTSKMRAECLRTIFPGSDYQVINTNIPFHSLPRFWRSLGFRYKVGLVIDKVNRFICEQIRTNAKYDLVWVDKNIFIKESTVKTLRLKGKTLVHYTPDCAFYSNSSKYFRKSLQYFDYVVTTKSFEISYYQKYTSDDRIVLINQGFDPDIHKSHHTFEEKDDSVVFIGLYEKYRGEIIELMISNGIRVKVGGRNWEKFAGIHRNNSCFTYLGNNNYGEVYTKHISYSKLGLGLLSRRFPELHTTRTVEIPACGSALLTERNMETEHLFGDDEAIFYTNEAELIEIIRYYLENQHQLEELAERGNKRAVQSGYDYQSIMKSIIKRISGLEEL